MSKFSIVANADGVAEIVLYDVIDRLWGISAKTIYDQLKELDNINTLRVRINSSGGSVFEGMAIYNLFKSHEARVVVVIDGVAASMASIVAMAGDEIEMGEGAYLMIHDPLGYVRGVSEEMRDMADLLDKMRDQLIGIYARRTSQSVGQIQEWMKAETWMTTDDAIANGFADRSVAGLQIAAMAPVGLFDNPPQSLLNDGGKWPEKGEVTMAETNAPKSATWQELKACCPGADAEFLGSQMDMQVTAETASQAWMSELQKRSEADAKARQDAEDARAEAEKQAADAKAEAEAAKVGKPGVEMLGGGKTSQDSDPIAAWKTAVEAKISQGMDRVKATRMVVREDPELHATYIAAVNAT